MSKIKTVEKLITPKWATSILETHYENIVTDEFRQRRISELQVARFAADMNNGSWLLCPQPISFDEDGNLIDGQHRLEAVRKSGKDIPMMVSTGWPVSTMGENGVMSTIDVIDRGRTRSVGQQLVLHGDVYGNAMAASIASIVGLVYFGARSPSVSYASTIYILDKLDMRRHIYAIAEKAKTKLFAGRTVGPLALYHTVKPKKAEEFADRLYSMNLEKDTGPQVYARYLRDYTPRVQMNAIAALSKCIMSWDSDEPINRVRQTEGGLLWLGKLNPKLSESIKEVIGKAVRVAPYKHYRKGKNITSYNNNVAVAGPTNDAAQPDQAEAEEKG